MSSPGELLKNVSAGRFKPAYYFFGAEDFRITEAIKFLASKFLPESERATNFRRLDGRKTSVADLIVELSSLSLLGDRRVVAVSNFQSYKPTEWKKVLVLMEGSDPTRLVVFSSPSSVLSRGRAAFVKKAFFKGVSKVAETVEFNRLTPREMAPKVRSRLGKADIKIDPKALQLLTEMLAGSHGGFQSEIDKLIDFKSSGETVTIDDIRKVCSGYEVFNIFDLADSIIAGQTKLVLKMINRLLADGNGPVTIGILLQQHFMSLFLVKGGRNPLGNRQWLANKFRGQAVQYTSERLEQIIRDIARCDANMRGGDLKPEAALEMMVLGLMRN